MRARVCASVSLQPWHRAVCSKRGAYSVYNMSSLGWECTRNKHKTCLGTLSPPTANRCASASLTSWHRHSPSQYTRAGPRAARQAGRCHPGGEWHTPHHKAPSLNFWPLQTACTFSCHKSFLCCSDSRKRAASWLACSLAPHAVLLLISCQTSR